jgi:hypothetical protein
LLDDALPTLGARVNSMSDRLCHCRTRSQAAICDESEDDAIPNRMASPASKGSYHTPMCTDGGEEVVCEMSEETAINPVSSSPELEYEEENKVAVPIPPPSVSPVRGQHWIYACRWALYNGVRCPGHTGGRGWFTESVNCE